uniref:Uncharacterized protein n=1 Tax=Hemiselmis tepida TaxID=464990 RepID=A0A7S0YEA8_9CRYP|mmetsp:Transcript_10075/g.26077  ORF Transcript_10075/g.26077 Transcript_10075/m.26077 type:complete len:186 (+) Transcript_10075:393-950(+)|eukprot:CAMPEP_0174932968 /NCGR_PEP_ID=MMETSP1355-20121228/42847_1 /TAXON_ID=464990 /ORGANISM="Hemiselmis tepida, Strain CCMP443" /LENGTH=185 /DNA_ID=CAMNT_0016179437 /DNA_START=361 /DNA_END=918 /DNA_ORIENTATION=+
MVSETAAALGKSLWLACKCGDHDKALELLEQIENFPSDSVERDEALEYTDNKSNSILHVACASNGDGVEVQKKRVVGKLLDLGFILDDDNSDGKTCRDMAPKDFEKDLRELEERKKRGGRGASIIAEYRSFKNVAEAGFMAVAAIKFKSKIAKSAWGQKLSKKRELEQFEADAAALSAANSLASP